MVEIDYKISVDYGVFKDDGGSEVELKAEKHVPMFPYSIDSESYMRLFYSSLNEKDKRHYAALEAEKLCYGGVSYIAELLGCSRTTIHEGIKELKKKQAVG